MKNKRLLFLLLLVSVSFSSRGQESDAGLATYLTLEKKFSSKTTLIGTEELRFNENVSELGTIISDLGIEYKVVKKFFLSLNYRYKQVRRDDDSYSSRHRYYVDGTYKFKVEKFGINLRERFESEYKDVQSSETGNVPKNSFRSKITFKYNPGKRYKPYLSGELFYQLNNPDGNTIDKERFIAGVDYEIDKYLSMDVFYVINKEVNVKNPLTEYIAGLGFTWKL